MLQVETELFISQRSVEYYLEQTILTLKGENVSGIVPSTDCKVIGKLIKEMDALADTISSTQIKEIVRSWCKAAPDAFVCRNAILHGQCFAFSRKEMMFITNTSYESELRKRESRSFKADVHTCGLLADVFSTLLKSIQEVYLFSTDAIKERDLNCVSLTSKLWDAVSTTNELANLAEAVNNEKY